MIRCGQMLLFQVLKRINGDLINIKTLIIKQKI